MSYRVNCPNCRQRLFDKTPELKGGIEIKCNKCKKVVKLNFKNK